MNYFEAHITMKAKGEDIAALKQTVERLAKWKFSKIDGDPVLGDGVKCYATMLYNERMGVDAVIAELHKAAGTILAFGGIVLRRKVEMVVYDDRSDKVKPCDGTECAACQEATA